MNPMQDLIPVDAEEVAMGAILIDNRVITKAARILKSEYFGTESCRLAYEACLTVWRNGEGVDLVTVANELKRKELWPRCAPFELSRWTSRVAASDHFESHASIIRDHYSMRVLRGAGEQLMRGTKPAEDPTELLAPLSEAMGIAVGNDSDGDVNAGELAYEIMNGTERPKPIYLGIQSLDGLVFVLPGNVVTIRAAAGAGKTAMVLSIIMNLIEERKPWIVSLEMSPDELIMRALCQIAEVDMDLALIGRLTEQQRSALANAASQYAEILGRLSVDKSSSMSIDEFMAKAEHKVKSEGVQLIAIDYAQLMDADKKAFPNSTLQLEAISKGIRATARKLNVPIILVVHQNASGEDHGSSQFEKDAHVRLAISRDPSANVATIDVLKNRNGRVGGITTPVVMRYGIVGRNGPPSWVRGPHVFDVKAGFDKPHPDSWNQMPDPNDLAF